ncbi:MAG: hypothetical protein JW709_11090 [Sedimentisphaerales bacterium]|nr:hypothetical protein [Sedimentisphaerales bacterium]
MVKAQIIDQRQRGEFEAIVVRQAHIGTDHQTIILRLNGAGGAAFAQAQPGQFVQLACRDIHNPRSVAPLLRRPLSIAGIRITTDQTEVQFIFRLRGPGTQWLGHRREGELVNLLGPLGRGFRLPESGEQSVLLLGGGIGLPPMFFLADVLRAQGFNQVVGFAAARSRESLTATFERDTYNTTRCTEPQLVLEEFNRSSTPCIIATDDGSLGCKGSVVAASEAFLDRQPKEYKPLVCACGPQGMLRATAELAEKRDLACQVCLEEYMACGIGVCQSCVTRLRNGEDDKEGSYKLVCSHGPVFDARRVVWD